MLALMKRFLQILGFLTGLLILAGVLVYMLVPHQKLLAAITPEIGNVQVSNTRIGEEYTTLQVRIDVTSKLIPVFIDSLAYDIRLYGERITQGGRKFPAASKKGKVQQLALPIGFSQNKVRDLMNRPVREASPVEARIQAFYNIPLLGRKRFEMNKKLPFAFPVLPPAGLMGVEK